MSLSKYTDAEGSRLWREETLNPTGEATLVKVTDEFIKGFANDAVALASRTL